MKFELKQNLGTDDATLCNKELCASLSLKAADLVAGTVVDLPEPAAQWLTKRYPALLQPVNVRGEAKKPEITAPAK